MWYVIQTTSGNEHEVCLWINTYVDKSYYTRCFVPLFEDVWRKEGIGHISIKRLFTGYLFLETDTPEKVYDELKRISKYTMLLSVDDKSGKVFTSLHKDEEAFFDTILSDGIMKVSYVHMNKNGRLDRVIGPLQSYEERIVKLDLPHRRAIVNIQILGENRRIKFPLWLDVDPLIDWIEEEKKKYQTDAVYAEKRPVNPWDWKEWKRINQNRKKEDYIEETLGYKTGDFVINMTGLYGDTPLEIVDIHPEKNSITVAAPLFGNMTNVEMSIDEVAAREI